MTTRKIKGWEDVNVGDIVRENIPQSDYVGRVVAACDEPIDRIIQEYDVIVVVERGRDYRGPASGLIVRARDRSVPFYPWVWDYSRFEHTGISNYEEGTNRAYTSGAGKRITGMPANLKDVWISAYRKLPRGKAKRWVARRLLGARED